MSTLGAANRTQLGFIREDTFGTTPTDPNFQIMRLTAPDLAANKATVVSDELRADRQTADLAEVGFESGGSVDIEMSLGGTYDKLIEAVLAFDPGASGLPSWITGNPLTNSDVDLTFAAIGGNQVTVTDASSLGSFTNVVVDQWIYFTDSTPASTAGALPSTNRGWFKVTGLNTVDSVDVDDPAGVLADLTTTSGTCRVKGGTTYINGVALYSYSLEERFLDVGHAKLFRGQRPGTWGLNLASNSILTGSFGFSGTEVVVESPGVGSDPSWIGAGAYVPATTTGVLNATSNVGQILRNGSAFPTPVQSIEVTLDNALRSQQAVSNKFPVGIAYGSVAISGTITPYLGTNLDLFNDMLTHADVALAFSVSDIAGNSMRVEYPRIKIASDDIQVPGKDTDNTEAIEFQAIVSADGSHMIRVDIA